MSTTPPAHSEPTTVIFGGRDIGEVKLNDGRTERVFVRTLPLRLVPRYLELKLVGGDQGVIELCLDLPENGADKFGPEAQEQLLQICDELNFATARRWIERSKSDRAKLTPLLEALHKAHISLMGPSLQQLATLLTSSLTHALHSASASTPSSTSPAPSSNSSSDGTPAASATTPPV